jgi:hypothetical protein
MKTLQQTHQCKLLDIEWTVNTEWYKIGEELCATIVNIKSAKSLGLDSYFEFQEVMMSLIWIWAPRRCTLSSVTLG